MAKSEINILEIPFTTLTQNEILAKIVETLNSQNKLFLATPNPEMLLASLKNTQFKKTLQSTDLNLPDGNGLIWANNFQLSTNKKANWFWLTLNGVGSLIAFSWHKKDDRKIFNQAIHGSDLTIAMLQHPEISKHGFYLLGNKHGLNPKISDLTATAIHKAYPHTQVVGHTDSDLHDQTLINQINESKAEILLVGFGAPAQETWIEQHLAKLTHVKVAIGIGGTFDFIAGIIPRAPIWMRKSGLEWLFRLYKQPKRIGRIFNATIVFPYQIIKHRLANPDKRKT